MMVCVLDEERESQKLRVQAIECVILYVFLVKISADFEVSCHIG